MRLLFARHGESEANLRHEIANRDSRHALTDTGRRQADDLAESLRSERLTRIYTSPVRRAVETSDILGRRLGVPVEPAGALREYDCGIYEGRSDDAAWAAYADAQNQWFEHGRAGARMEGGESLAEMRARFVPFVEGLVAGQGPDDRIALISHGGLYRCVLAEILDGIEPRVARDRGLGYAAYVTVESRPAERLVCIDWPG